MKVRRFLILLTLIVSSSTSVAANDHLWPVDEAVSNPDFFAFRSQLQAAIARRDSAFLLSVIKKDIFFSFGSESGIDDFAKSWEVSSPESPVWPMLAETLALGGTFDSEGAFTAPYVFANWPHDKDAFTYVVVMGTNIPVYSQPNSTSQVIDHLDFSVVEVADDQIDQGVWTRIKLDENRTGFVESNHVRSSLADRLLIQKIDGRWQIGVLVAGD